MTTDSSWEEGWAEKREGKEKRGSRPPDCRWTENFHNGIKPHTSELRLKLKICRLSALCSFIESRVCTFTESWFYSKDRRNAKSVEK